MPIRFRCAFCNQLMGIARRKAGTIVRCPNCAGQVVVPLPEGESAQPVPATVKDGMVNVPRPPLFEENDFEEALSSAAGTPEPIESSQDLPSAPVPMPIPAPPTYQGEVDRSKYEAPRFDFPADLPTPSTPPGIFLSPAMATILSVALVVALALAFTAGLFVGRFLYAPAHEERTTQSHFGEWPMPFHEIL